MEQQNLPLIAPVRLLMTRPPLFVAADATVQQAALAMQAAQASSCLIAADLPGILTDRDLRNRVLAAGLGPATPARQIMSQPLKTLDSDTPVYAALLFMLGENIHHLIVVEEGKIVGVVSSSDLLRQQSQSPLLLHRHLQTLSTVGDAAHYAQDVAATVELLFQGGLGAAPIGRLISSLNDTLVKRLAQLAEQELGPPPTPYAWIVFGSEGRHEQTLLTDQDNALVYQTEAPEAAHYFARLSRYVVDGLITAGFPPCPGGYMATNWCKPLAEWRQRFINWVQTPEPEALLDSAIFFDFRHVHGALSLEPLEEILTTAHANPLFMTHFMRLAQRFPPPLGFFNRIRTNAGMVDLKKGGITPIVGLARACALAAGSQERATLERLTVATAHNLLSPDDAAALADIFQFLLFLRLRRQLAMYKAGQPLENQIHLGELTRLEQNRLQQAFVTIRQLQDLLGETYHTNRIN